MSPNNIEPAADIEADAPVVEKSEPVVAEPVVDQPVAVEPQKRKRARLGAWSFIFALLLAAAIGGDFLLISLGVSGDHDRIQSLFPVVVGVSAIVVPILAFFSLLFGVLALFLNRAIGKIFGAIGIIILLSIGSSIALAVSWIASLNIGLF
jgi:hypothetical protein